MAKERTKSGSPLGLGGGLPRVPDTQRVLIGLDLRYADEAG